MSTATRKTGDVLDEVSTAEWANEQVAAVRDDPTARIALVERLYHGPSGTAPRHLPYSRAALSFMRWQLRRGVLAHRTTSARESLVACVTSGCCVTAARRSL